MCMCLHVKVKVVRYGKQTVSVDIDAGVLLFDKKTGSFGMETVTHDRSEFILPWNLETFQSPLLSHKAIKWHLLLLCFSCAVGEDSENPCQAKNCHRQLSQSAERTCVWKHEGEVKDLNWLTLNGLNLIHWWVSHRNEKLFVGCCSLWRLLTPSSLSWMSSLCLWAPGTWVCSISLTITYIMASNIILQENISLLFLYFACRGHSTTFTSVLGYLLWSGSHPRRVHRLPATWYLCSGHSGQPAGRERMGWTHQNHASKCNQHRLQTGLTLWNQNPHSPEHSMFLLRMRSHIYESFDCLALKCVKLVRTDCECVCVFLL